MDSDVKSRIIGVEAVMNEFKFLIGLKLSENTLKMTDNLSRTLQKTALSTAETQRLASLTVRTLQGLRMVEAWETFYAHVQLLQKELGVCEAVLP